MTTPTITSSEKPTGLFRWLDVGGTQNVLQQQWAIETHGTSKGEPQSRELEWRNVPVVKKERGT